MLDQEAAKNGSNGGRDRREAGPCADSPAAITLSKRCADNGETSRNQQRGANSLHRAHDNQLTDTGRQTAASRGCSEKNNAGSVYAFATIDGAKRSSDQNQSSKQESVSFDNPLGVDGCRVEFALKSGQREIDHIPVDKRKA